MHIPVDEAEAKLTDLVRRAEACDDIVITRHGQSAVRPVPVRPVPDVATQNVLLDALQVAGAKARGWGPRRAQPGLSSRG